MFGLYDLTKIMKVSDSIKPSLVYEYLKSRYKTLSITKKQFSDTFYRKANLKYFNKTSDGQYFLTPTGEQIVKEKINQDNNQS